MNRENRTHCTDHCGCRTLTVLYPSHVVLTIANHNSANKTSTAMIERPTDRQIDLANTICGILVRRTNINNDNNNNILRRRDFEIKLQERFRS